MFFEGWAYYNQQKLFIYIVYADWLIIFIITLICAAVMKQYHGVSSVSFGYFIRPIYIINFYLESYFINLEIFTSKHTEYPRWRPLSYIWFDLRLAFEPHFYWFSFQANNIPLSTFTYHYLDWTYPIKAKRQYRLCKLPTNLHSHDNYAGK